MDCQISQRFGKYVQLFDFKSKCFQVVTLKVSNLSSNLCQQTIEMKIQGPKQLQVTYQYQPSYISPEVL